jgi:4-hydroxythreonine-4-phosphate dehydrogenase
MMAPALLALTMGEPGGVAGEITVAAWKHFSQTGDLAFFVIGDKQLLTPFCPDSAISVIDKPDQAREVFGQALPVLLNPVGETPVAGVASPKNAAAVLASIDKSVEFAMAGKVDGIVTNPIHKESLYDAGFSFQGHTDYLAHLAGGNDTVMMLSSKDLRTVPITVHIAIRDVATRLSKALIIEQTRKTAEGLAKWFGLAKPRIGVTGLNPHAGENGAMGDEEIHMIGPAIETLKQMGFDASGPLPADTLFHDEARRAYDVVMCMYHDQALIPVKTLGFHDGVNTTLGLPFVRTSPDHGTALGIAGKAIANPSSLIAALHQAAFMAGNGRVDR